MTTFDFFSVFKKKLPVLDVYISRIPENLQIKPVFPPERYDEIQKVKNESVKCQKYWSWKVLENALSKSFGLKMEDIRFSKTKKGKWLCNKCYFSISNTEKIVAVAVSNKTVGVDIENIEKYSSKEHKIKNLFERIANPAELKTANEEISVKDFLELWTKKEAAYKSEKKQKNFNPQKMVLNKNYVFTKFGVLENTGYCLSLYSPLKNSVQFLDFTEE
jgi:phosphopantetheinyl transferase